jgi:hypothetical protein
MKLKVESFYKIVPVTEHQAIKTYESEGVNCMLSYPQCYIYKYIQHLSPVISLRRRDFLTPCT